MSDSPSSTALYQITSLSPATFDLGQLGRGRIVRKVSGAAIEIARPVLEEFEGNIAFVDFIRLPIRPDTQGALFFTYENQVALHVTNALIGYEGGGPDLSRELLRLLGVGDQVFDALNEAAKAASRNEYYVRLGS